MHRSKHGSLQANVAQTIELQDVPAGGSIYIANVSRGKPIYVRLDGKPAVVRGDDTSVVFSFRKFSVLSPEWTGDLVTSVSLICEDGAEFAVEVSR